MSDLQPLRIDDDQVIILTNLINALSGVIWPKPGSTDHAIQAGIAVLGDDGSGSGLASIGVHVWGTMPTREAVATAIRERRTMRILAYATAMRVDDADVKVPMFLMGGQVGDRSYIAKYRAGRVLETCPPDKIATHADLVWLDPGFLQAC